MVLKRSQRPDSEVFKPSYLLSNNELEDKRLQTMHGLYKAVLNGHLVNPTVTFAKGSSVLESAVGNGVWMLDFAKSYPDTSIHGIDIQPHLFPQNLPPNINLSVCSITTLPLNWGESFDFVHQRLLSLALTRSEWEAALSEMFRVVKPGGWIQLEEAITDFPNSGPATQRLGAAINQTALQRGVMSRCAESIPELLSKAGFINVTTLQYDINFGGRAGGELAQAGAFTIRELFRSMKHSAVSAGVVESLERYDDLVKEAEREWHTDSGPSKNANCFPFFQFCAQRPRGDPDPCRSSYLYQADKYLLSKL